MKTALGTFSMMAPEIHMKMPYEGVKVDLFAAALVLFTMVSQRPPFASAHRTDPHYRLIATTGREQFWQAHCTANEGEDIYSADFKDLFEKMIQVSPNKRLSIPQILAHPWMRQTMATEAEIQEDFTRRQALLEAEAKRERLEKKE